jgi:hypothetical protein
MAGVLVVMLGALLFAGLAVAVGTIPAIALTVLAFAAIVWFCVPTEEPQNLHAERLLSDGQDARTCFPPSPQPSPASGEGAGFVIFSRPRREGKSRELRKASPIAGVFLAIVIANFMPGCSTSPVDLAAYESLDTNRDQLDPMTLRGIEDAVSDGDISASLADQYRGLMADDRRLIDALLGRESAAPVVEVQPEE